jgi:hypothetical protein
VAELEDRLAQFVDQQWYFSTNPDVRAAGTCPAEHYRHFGRFEGRAPRRTQASELKEMLWSQGEVSTQNELEALAGKKTAPEDERIFAAWALAQWYACLGDWTAVARVLNSLHQEPMGTLFVPHLGPVLLRIEALRRTGARDSARRLLEQEIRHRGPIPDLFLAGAALANGDRTQWVNRIFHGARLLTLRNRDPAKLLCLDLLIAAAGWRRKWAAMRCWLKTRPNQPSVSVLVPAHNATATLATALSGLREQTWEATEVVVIDDASTDDTYDIAADFARRDTRFRVLRHDRNQGSYAARNTGLSQCSGSFITVHDADDWSHPQKLELQALALLRDKSVQGSISHWARTTTDLEPAPERMETGYVHRNLSSLMFRRSVFERLGYWDRVAVGGDSEYAHRITRVYGPDAIRDVLPGIPLSLGRVQAGSLTRVDATHWRTFYGGVRRAYFDAAVAWHERTDDRELYLDERPTVRPFEAPEAIRR